VQFDKFASWFRTETGLQREEKRAKEKVSLHDINHLNVQILPVIRPVGKAQNIDRDAPSSDALSELIFTVAACSLRAAERIANAFSKSISFVSSLSPPTYGRCSTSVLITTRPETLFLELTSILLFGQLKIYFAAVGTSYSVTIKFETVGEDIYREATDLMLGGY
jgi:hypothetical protein